MERCNRTMMTKKEQRKRIVTATKGQRRGGKGGQSLETGPSTGRERLARALAAQAHESYNAGSSDGEDSAESDSGEERPHKRQKLQPSDMPWHGQRGEPTGSLNPSCVKSADIIRRLHQDLKSESYLLDSPQTLREEFPCLNGSTFLSERQSTLTGSCRRSIVLQSIRRERLALETQKLALVALRLNGRWRQVLNGLLPGDPLRERLALSLSIGNENSLNTETILSDCLQPSTHVHIPKSSCSTEELEMRLEGLEMRLEGDNLSCLPTTSISHPCMQQLYKTTGSSITGEESLVEETSQKNQNPKSVAGIMVHPGVASLTPDANINISASPVDRADMERRPVEKENREELLGLKPKYLRQNLWSLETESKMIASEWMESAEPLPRPPACEYENLPVCQSLSDRPDLFQVVSPIRVDMLERLLRTHPNKEFVASVVAGLRYGFWP